MIRDKAILTVAIETALATLLVIASYYNTDSELYLFPRIASALILLLALIQLSLFFRNRYANTSPGEDVASDINWKALLPGGAIVIAYIGLIETLGFYLCTFLVFLAITSFYGKRRATNIHAFCYKTVVGLIFVTVLYVLFFMLLNVRTPTGVFL